jgi:hypothetical protein
MLSSSLDCATAGSVKSSPTAYGVFKGIVDLQAAINRFLDETNDNPKRGKQVLESIH